MNTLYKTSLVISIVGALNWGLIGLFGFNLVETIFGINTFLTTLIYILVGVSGSINIMLLFYDLDKK